MNKDIQIDKKDDIKEVDKPTIEGKGITYSVPKKTRGLKRPSKRVLSALLVIVLISGLFSGYDAYSKRNIKCSDELVFDARGAIGKQNYKELEDVQKQILAIKDYQKDIDCVYPLAYYRVLTGDTQQASTDIKLLEGYLREGQKINEAYGKTLPVTFMKQIVTANQKGNDSYMEFSKLASPSVEIKGSN